MSDKERKWEQKRGFDEAQGAIVRSSEQDARHVSTYKNRSVFLPFFVVGVTCCVLMPSHHAGLWITCTELEKSNLIEPARVGNN
jgi:hypothetical protein